MQRIWFSVMAMVAAWSGPLACAQTLIVNGGFESEPNFGVNGDSGYTALTGAQIPGWTIVSGHAVTVHSTNLYPYITGSFSVNTYGEGINGHNADFYQDFATTNGASYQLTFDWQGWVNSGAAQLEVLVFDTITSATLFDGVYAYNVALGHESATFAGTGNDLRLEIRENPESGFNDNRFIVDNFAVIAIPEPAAWTAWSALGAAAGLLLRTIRRRAHAA